MASIRLGESRAELERREGLQTAELSLSSFFLRVHVTCVHVDLVSREQSNLLARVSWPRPGLYVYTGTGNAVRILQAAGIYKCLWVNVLGIYKCSVGFINISVGISRGPLNRVLWYYLTP